MNGEKVYSKKGISGNVLEVNLDKKYQGTFVVQVYLDGSVVNQKSSYYEISNYH